MKPIDEIDADLKQAISITAATGSYTYFILPDGSDLSKIPQDPKNPLTEAKVQLGNFLFFETGLAQDALTEEGIGTYSCSTCHVPEAGFKPGKAQGIADGGTGYGYFGEERLRNTDYAETDMDVQGARPLSMVNVGYAENTLWNGRFGSTGVNVGTEDVWDNSELTVVNHYGFQGIESQNFEGMKLHRLTMNPEMVVDLGYKEMFDEVFANESDPEKRYSDSTASLAISAYIRTITASSAPFQNWLRGDKFAMDTDEKRGAMLFFGKASCTKCHYGPGFSSLEFHAMGVKDMYQQPSFNTSSDDDRNLGRAGFTGNEEDMYAFKVPQLYNLAETPFYFHGASKTSIRDVVEYKNLAQSENENVPQSMISEKFQPLDLTNEEINQLTLFLTKSLRDPNLLRYKPAFLPSGNCFPNADPQSIMDLDCQ
jgi:cytochrome c peroxidase